MAEPISLDEIVVTPEEPVSIDTGITLPRPLTPELAAQRADKAEFGVGKLLNRPYNEFYEYIAAGEENQLRLEAATKIDQQKQTQKLQLIQEFANRKGGPLFPQEVKLLEDTLRLRDPTSADTVFEENFAKEYLDLGTKVGAIKSDSEMYKAIQEVPKQVEEYKGLGRTAVTQRLIALRLAEDLKEDIKAQSTLGFIADVAKSFVPFYPQYKLSGHVPGVTSFQGKGYNLDAQAKELLKLPIPQYAKKLSEIAETIKKDNPTLALEFVNAVAGMSTSDVQLNNLMTAVDLTMLKPLLAGKLSSAVLRKVGLINSAKEDVNAMVKAVAEGGADTKPLRMEAAGDLTGAAATKYTADTVKTMAGKESPLTEIVEALPSVLKNIEENAGSHSQTTVNALKEATLNDTLNIVNTVSNAAKVNISPALAVESVAKQTLEALRNIPQGYNVIDIGKKLLYDDKLNLWHYNVDIGSHAGDLFFSYSVAQNYMKAHGITNGIVTRAENHANGWVIRLTKPLPQNLSVIKDGALQAPGAKDPENGFLTAFFGRYRTPMETLSPDQIKNRLVATYGPNEFYRLAYEIGKDLRKLSHWTLPGTAKKQRWEDFKRVLETQSKETDYTDLRPGKWSNNPAELDDYYNRTVGRLPDEAEVKGYFSFKRMMELKNYLENRKAYRDKSMAGTETHTISTLGPNKVKLEATFDGVKLSKFPTASKGIVAFVGKNIGDERIDNLGSFNPATLKSLVSRVDKGELIVIRPYDTKSRPLQNFGIPLFGDRKISYIIAEKVESKPIAYQQIPNRIRLELEQDYPFAVKQARIKTDTVKARTINHYEGDAFIMGAGIRAQGKEWAANLDEVRKFLQAGNVAGAQEFNNKNFHVDWDTVHGWFKSDVTPEGLPIAPKLSLNEPIQLAEKYKYLADAALEARYTDKAKKIEFRDGTRDDLATQHRFNPELPDNEALYTLKDEGTKGNPLYKVIPSQTIEVIPMMERSLSRMIKTNFMDDYKTFSTTDWLEKAKRHLDVDVDSLHESPLWHFYNPKYHPSVPADVKAKLEVQRFQINQLLGIPSENEGILQRLAQDLSDSVYTKFGPKAVLISPTWLLPKLADPTAFLRSVTFHATLGLFSIPQLLVQMQTFTTIYGIAGPGHASSGTKAALLHLWGSYSNNPAILDKLDALASTKIPGMKTFKPGEWKEARELGRSTGFFNVAGDYYLDIYNPKFIVSRGKQFLDLGTMFFKGGERSVRAGAWYTAYREFRDVNPTKRITIDDTNTILQRADLLNVNMSRASNSLLHTGKMAATSQFLSYQIRQFELVMGKRLTQMERARLVLVNAAMYGIPTATGLSGFPFAEFMRKSALEGGYKVGENWLETAATEGIPSMVSGLVTGVYPNIGDSWGNSGLELIKDAIRSDESWLKIVGGAAFGKLAGAFSHLDPYYFALQSAIRGDGEFKPKVVDLLDVFTEINSLRDIKKAYVAFNTGRLISKNESVQAEGITPIQAATMLLTRLQPQNIADDYTRLWSLKDQKESADKGLKWFIKEYRRALIALENNDPEQHQHYIKRAFNGLEESGYPREDLMKAVAIASRGLEPLTKGVNWDFYVKKAPEKQRERRLETFQKMKE